MLLAIAGAMTLFLGLIAAKVVRGSRIRGDFALLFSAFMAGWLAAEILAVLAPPASDLVVEGLHFGVILLFAVFLGLRWRWAFRRALEGADE